MPLDHFGNATGTFKNRYWVNDTYYKPGGPVFCASSGSQVYFFPKIITYSLRLRRAKRRASAPVLPASEINTLQDTPLITDPASNAIGVSWPLCHNAAGKAIQRSGNSLGTQVLWRFPPFPSQRAFWLGLHMVHECDFACNRRILRLRNGSS